MLSKLFFKKNPKLIVHNISDLKNSYEICSFIKIRHEWCLANCEDSWYINTHDFSFRNSLEIYEFFFINLNHRRKLRKISFYFDDTEEAVLYKLRWA